MKWWQDPEQREEVKIGDIIRKGDIFVWPDGKNITVDFTIGSRMSLEEDCAVYRRVYPEVVALRMENQDLTEENVELKKEITELKKELEIQRTITETTLYDMIFFNLP